MPTVSAASGHVPTSVNSRTPSAPRPNGRAIAKARNLLITQLKEDHQRVKKAYARYRRLDAETDADARQSLLAQVLDELEVHARLEETLLYPEARAALADTSQVDEAVVEHEMLHLLIDQIRPLAPGSDEQQARFTVLCEYTLHHVKEEEREMFPQLMKVKLDWLRLSREFEEQRAAGGPMPEPPDPIRRHAADDTESMDPVGPPPEEEDSQERGQDGNDNPREPADARPLTAPARMPGARATSSRRRP